jgi:WS/DGAT/MGAT family acyltransferase
MSEQRQEPTAKEEREQRFERRMTDAEALMWNVEKDPWLNPNGGVIAVLEEPPDFDDFYRRIAYAVSHVPRLHERVVPTLGRFSPPVWRTDPEFDLGYHVQRVALAEPGTRRQLLDLVTALYQDPYDRSRPLWRYFVIEGLEGGQAALLWKIHHSITDGMGMAYLAEYHLQRERAPEPVPDVDIRAVLAQAVEAEKAEADAPLPLPLAIARTTTHLLRRQAGINRRLLGELAMWGADPTRIGNAVGKVTTTVQQVRGQLVSRGDGNSGSPLWKGRSRRRHLEILDVPLEMVQATAKKLGGSVNDVFVTGAVLGVLAYHERRDAPVESLNLSFVVSTRTDKAIGGNSFTPTRLNVPGGPMSVQERFTDIRDRMAAKRAEVKGPGMLNSLAGVANLLPTGVVTRAARSQATRQDFATSNVRGPRTPRYVSGAQITGYYAFGPVAGTAFNLTTLSYLGQLEIGLFADPAAVEDPAELRRDMADGYVALAEAAGVR